MFTSLDNTVQFPLASNLACKATFVAIGSGGNSRCSGCGGGSGYISNVLVNISSTEYEVTVGGRYDVGDSFIKNTEEVTIIKANRGGNAYFGGGGNGYSGGGYHGKGGSNGMNGEGENGGSGSGTNISEIFLNHFVLTSGDGGEPNYGGGGGGGILVDNFGPDSDDSYGKGYGGGDGGGGNGYGLPGMVLIEVDTI